MMNEKSSPFESEPPLSLTHHGNVSFPDVNLQATASAADPLISCCIEVSRAVLLWCCGVPLVCFVSGFIELRRAVLLWRSVALCCVLVLRVVFVLFVALCVSGRCVCVCA